MKQKIFLGIAILSCLFIGQSVYAQNVYKGECQNIIEQNLSNDVKEELYEVVKTAKLNIRNAPSTNSKIIGKLSERDIIRVLNANNGWAYFMHEGRKAYVSLNYLAKIESVYSAKDNKIEENQISYFHEDPVCLEDKSEENIEMEAPQKSRAGKFGLMPEFMFGYIIPNFGELASITSANFSMGLSISLGGRIYATNNLFFEAGIGYKWNSISYDLKNTSCTVDCNMHMITIPIHVGYSIPSQSKVSIALVAGTRLDIGVASKATAKIGTVEEKKDLDTPFTAMLECGFDVRFPSSALRFLLGYSPSNKNKYTMISVGWVSEF